ncbi:hypothetical protein ACWD1Y_41520 [Streptomyces sp. NPDC002814]
MQTSAYASDALPGETVDVQASTEGLDRLKLPTDLTAQVGALAASQSGTATA